MNAQGVIGITLADVPVILTQQSGTASPIGVTDEAGATVLQSALTALFDQNGVYVGSYGIDPSTGAFAAWNAQGQETGFQAFAAEHQLANGATPIASDGGNAVLYNASGQIIGLEAAGYLVDTSDAAQNTPAPIDGDTTVYDETGVNSIESFGYSEAAQDLQIDGSSADTYLERMGFTPAQISQVEQSLAATGSWDLSNATDAAVREALIESGLSGQTCSLGTVSAGVYDAQGNYLGSFSQQQGSYAVFNQDGSMNTTPVLADDGVSYAQQTLAYQGLTVSGSVRTTTQAIVTSDYTNLRQINVALSAYLVSQGAPDSIGNAVDLTDGGTFEGVTGVDTATGQFAFQESTSNGDTIVDLDSALESEGFTASTLASDANLEDTAGPISSADFAALQAVASAVDSAVNFAVDISELSTAETQALTSAQIAGLSAAQIAGLMPQQISALSASQIASFSSNELAELASDQWDSFTLAQLGALSTAQLSGTPFPGITPNVLNQLSKAQLESLQVPDLGAGVYNLNTTTLAGLTAAQFSQLFAPGAGTVQWLSASQIASLTGPTVSELGAAVSALSPTQVAALSSAGFAALSAAQISNMTNWGLIGLTSSQIASLTSAQLSGFGANSLSDLSAQQVAEFTTAQLAALSPAAINSLNWINLPGISPASLASLSSAQVAAIDPYTLSRLSTAQLASLTPSQICALTASQIQHLGISQISSLSTTQVAALTTAQVGSLSPTQVVQFTALQLASLTCGAVSGLTTAQLNNVWLPWLSPAQIGGLSTSAIAGLSSSEISWLSTAQLTALTGQQMAAFSGGQIEALSPSQIAGFSGQQFSSFSGTQAASMSNAQIAALTTNALAGLTIPQLSSWSASQVAAINQSALANLTAQQMSTATVALVLNNGALPTSGTLGAPVPPGYTQIIPATIDGNGNTVYTLWNASTSTLMTATYSSTTSNLVGANWSTYTAGEQGWPLDFTDPIAQTTLSYQSNGSWQANVNAPLFGLQSTSIYVPTLLGPTAGYTTITPTPNGVTIALQDPMGNGLGTITIANQDSTGQDIAEGTVDGINENELIGNTVALLTNGQSEGPFWGPVIGAVGGLLLSPGSSSTITYNTAFVSGTITVSIPNPLTTGQSPTSGIQNVAFQGSLSFPDGSTMQVAGTGTPTVTYNDALSGTQYTVANGVMTAVEPDGTNWQMTGSPSGGGVWVYQGTPVDVPGPGPDGTTPPYQLAPDDSLPPMTPAIFGGDEVGPDDISPSVLNAAADGNDEALDDESNQLTEQLNQSLIDDPITIVDENQLDFENMQHNEDMTDFESMSQSGDFQIAISAAPT